MFAKILKNKIKINLFFFSAFSRVNLKCDFICYSNNNILRNVADDEPALNLFMCHGKDFYCLKKIHRQNVMLSYVRAQVFPNIFTKFSFSKR